MSLFVKLIKNYIGFLIVMLLSIQCEKPIERRAIETGSPLTILSPKTNMIPSNIEWYFAISPPKSITPLNSTFESARFTPDYPGDYDVVVELYNEKNDILSFKIFKYHAVGPKINVVNVEIEEPENDFFQTIKVDSVKTEMIVTDTLLNLEKVDSTIIISDTIKSISKLIKIEPQYTIQVFSLPDKNQANAKMDLLKNAGFDSYIVSFRHPEYDNIWYRIRVGKFIEYSFADSIAQQINQQFNISTWIDRLNK